MRQISAKPAARLDYRRQCHIVDQLAAHALNPANPRQGVPAQEDRAARRGRRGSLRIVDPGEWVEQLEEEYKSRDQAALGQAAAPQCHHFGHQVAAGRLDLGDQGGEVAWLVPNIGVGQQDQVGVAGLRHPLGDGP